MDHESSQENLIRPFCGGFFACLLFSPVIGSLPICFSSRTDTSRKLGYYAIGAGFGSIWEFAGLVVGLVYTHMYSDEFCNNLAATFAPDSPTTPMSGVSNGIYGNSTRMTPKDAIATDCKSFFKNNFAYPCAAASIIGMVACGLIAYGLQRLSNLRRPKDTSEEIAVRNSKARFAAKRESMKATQELRLSTAITKSRQMSITSSRANSVALSMETPANTSNQIPMPEPKFRERKMSEYPVTSRPNSAMSALSKRSSNVW